MRTAYTPVRTAGVLVPATPAIPALAIPTAAIPIEILAIERGWPPWPGEA
jgi:hypothetical protein